MKIAILVNTFYFGRGMDYVAMQQAKDLIAKGHKVKIITFEGNNESNKIDVSKMGWPKNNQLNFAYRLMFPLDLIKIAEISQKIKDYDVIISHFYPMTFLAFMTKLRYNEIKYIFLNHGIVDNKYLTIRERLYIKLLKLLTLISTSNADCVVSVSRYLNDSIKTDKVKFTDYPKIDISKFDYEISQIDDRLKDALSQEHPKYLYVGVITHYKGIKLLMKSFNIVLEKYPDAKLFLVGRRSYTFNRVFNLPRNVYFLGNLSDSELGYVYRNSDVYVTATTWEGFNLPLVEAQMLGKPVVAFDIGPHKEVVFDGKTGRLIEPFDINEFANSMVKVYEDKLRMGRNTTSFASQFSGKEDSRLTRYLCRAQTGYK